MSSTGPHTHKRERVAPGNRERRVAAATTPSQASLCAFHIRQGRSGSLRAPVERRWNARFRVDAQQTSAMTQSFI